MNSPVNSRAIRSMSPVYGIIDSLVYRRLNVAVHAADSNDFCDLPAGRGSVFNITDYMMH